MGLGNPGTSYATSRHNIGFLVVDAFAESRGFPAERVKRQVTYTEMVLGSEKVFLLKPQSFMNRSGPALRQFLGYHMDWEEVAPADPEAPQTGEHGRGRQSMGLAESLLVVHDDLDLPVGKLRFRSSGASGGHRGIESVIAALGTDTFGRLKVGIGRPTEAEGEAGGGADVDAARYVLEPLSREESRRLRSVAAHAARTLPVWLDEGLEVCSNRFNGVGGELATEE